MVAVLLFAIADAFQIRAQALGIDVPNQLLAMLPYLVTVIALAGPRTGDARPGGARPELPAHVSVDAVALITGGATGIGLATARALGRDGARLAIAALPEAPLAAAAADLRAEGMEVVAVEADVRRAADAKRAVDAALTTFGGLDALVNCAGTSAVGPLVDTPEDEFDRVFDTNVKGVYLMCRAAIPALVASPRGALVNVASQLALSAVAGFSAYCASKAAVLHLTRCLALELVDAGVARQRRLPGRRRHAAAAPRVPGRCRSTGHAGRPRRGPSDRAPRPPGGDRGRHPLPRLRRGRVRRRRRHRRRRGVHPWLSAR